MRYFDRNTWFWTFLSALFFIPFLGGVHLFDWDEINFAELAREMVVTGDFLRMQINYEIFTEKPPLFFWLQAISMKIFGVGEFAARLPNAILGVVVMPFIYTSGKFLIDRRFGYLWALSWFGSILPFLYFKSGIIDPYFNLFIFAGLYFLIKYLWKKEKYRELYFSKSLNTYFWLSGIFIGLAILTKGPVAYLVVFLTMAVYWALARFKLFISPFAFIKFSLIALGVFLLWFTVDALLHGPDFIIEFTIRQWELLTSNDAGHGGFPGYHFVVLLFGCFPASIFAIRGMGKFSNLPFHVRDFQKWMIILLWVVLILFSIVGTKIIHYSSLAYYPLTFLSALTLWHIVQHKISNSRWYYFGVLFIGFLIVAISLALPWAGLHLDTIKPLFEKDAFAMANLNADVPWTTWDYIPGLLMGAVLISYIFVVRKNSARGFKILFLGSGTWVLVALIFFIGMVERISQRASIEFFEDQVDKEVYVTTFGYKSYVPWFYAKIRPHTNSKATHNHWLLHGRIDKPVMISTKITAKDRLEAEIPDAVLLYEKNGFVFYKRVPRL